MRIALCNEVLGAMPLEAQCELAAALGYDGLEIAPFTLADAPERIDASEARRLRRVVESSGLVVTGLHWLLVKPSGLSLTDPDAACWAEAMARHVGLESLGGLSLCLRLLALVEVLGRAPWLRGMFSLGPEGAEFHPALLAAAAAAPLAPTGGFDDRALRSMLGRALPA